MIAEALKAQLTAALPLRHRLPGHHQARQQFKQAEGYDMTIGQKGTVVRVRR